MKQLAKMVQLNLLTHISGGVDALANSCIIIWVGFPRTGILAVSCHLKKNCWTAVAKPDLLPHFFLLFSGEHDSLYTLPQPQPPINSLQCTVMHTKCTKSTLLKFWCILNALQCIFGNWGVGGWYSVIRQSCSPENNKKKWRSKSCLAIPVQHFSHGQRR